MGSERDREAGGYDGERRPAAAAIGLALALGGLAVLASCSGRFSAEAPAAPATGARVVVLGTAQDGGLPQPGCACVRCERAAREPAFARLVSSVAVVGSGESPPVHLLDAGPDAPRQLARLGRLGLAKPGRNPVDGVLLTHAHVGHYLGLAAFGREVMGSTRLPVHCTGRMASFLESNGPWDLLVRLGHVELRRFAPGSSVDLGAGIRVEPIPVPHRDEYSDTVGFVVRGPARSVLYLPDLDSWDRGWTSPKSPEELLSSVDVALVDGTFFSEEELPGRSRSEVPHPPMIATAERFAPLFRDGTRSLLFIHLNHSNPAADPASTESARLRALGAGVASDGLEIPLE